MAGKQKHILLACGSGICTSTVARKKVEALLDSHGYKGQYTVTQTSMGAVPEQSRNFDFLVATSMPPKELHCPYVPGVCYLTGRGTQDSDEKILKLMEE